MPTSGTIPARGLRTQVIMATGSRKTRVAVRSVEELHAGRVLVLVPSLDLLAQTEAAWRQGGRRGPMLGVSSLRGEEVSFPNTRAVEELVEWTRGLDKVTVYATRASGWARWSGRTPGLGGLGPHRRGRGPPRFWPDLEAVGGHPRQHPHPGPAPAVHDGHTPHVAARKRGRGRLAGRAGREHGRRPGRPVRQQVLHPVALGGHRQGHLCPLPGRMRGRHGHPAPGRAAPGRGEQLGRSPRGAARRSADRAGEGVGRGGLTQDAGLPSRGEGGRSVRGRPSRRRRAAARQRP
ncbi:DEAD/DEAH box helicase family protein [Streptomyces goshikiensis]|uniref:DEAD/DEAH box helicase family protein n=1 Tax=Streptomyces goshikiensis TaxID=1942 RepID=UPI0037A17BB5